MKQRGPNPEALAWGCFALLALAAACWVAWHPGKAIDFHVYWNNARHYFRSGALMYGPQSGNAWPGGVYRYPPIFLDLFRPLAELPLAVGAALWAAGKLLLGGWLAIRLSRRWRVPSVIALWPGLLLIAPYFVQELRYGNAQFYIVALCVLALLDLDRPLRSGFWLGWAAALKVWPLFFIPCLLVRRRWRAVGYACASAAAWTVLPVLWRGGRQFHLLVAWLAQERAIAATSQRLGVLWYPGQSLHDVLARYLTHIDYSQLPDAHYVQVAWAHWSTVAVERLWIVLVVVLLAGLFYLLSRQSNEDAAAALMFCAVMIVEPHVHRLILETLLWPALWLSAEWVHRRFRPPTSILFWLAFVVSVVEPLVPGSARQRWLQVYGADFWLVLLPLTVAIVLAAATPLIHRPAAESSTNN
ncbi:MAG: glycosyltransferase family 87 protein [Terriglobales bacterium]